MLVNHFFNALFMEACVREFQNKLISEKYWQDPNTLLKPLRKNESMNYAGIK